MTIESGDNFPSVDDEVPDEEGGPVARSGFTYQDEIAVSFFLELLENTHLLKVHCETQDDILLVRAMPESTERLSEYVQVKSNELEQLWTVAELCKPKSGNSSSSIFETSLSRAKNKEIPQFRLVTLRDVKKELKILTYPLGNDARSIESEEFKDLHKNIDTRCPGAKSKRGYTASYWVENCLWECGESLDAARNRNLKRILELGVLEKRSILKEQAEVLLDDLRKWAQVAGDLKWKPDRDKKIITNQQMRDWWKKRTQELIDGAAGTSGGKLARKMQDALIPSELINIAADLRLGYSSEIRTRTYMQSDEAQRLQERVKSEMLSLRSQYVAGQINLDGVGFHALCVGRLDAINDERSPGTEDRSAFLKGCLYDITDRCLHRFKEHEQ